MVSMTNWLGAEFGVNEGVREKQGVGVLVIELCCNM